MNKLTIGIVGGMGPMAGVKLQELIVRMTPATNDQGHLPVVVYTNPQIPDRTESLFNNEGYEMTREIVKSIRVLESAGVDVAAIPCMTAHAMYESIARSVSIPVVSLPSITVSDIIARHVGKKVAVLGTSGTVVSQVLTRQSREVDWLLPSPEQLSDLMSAIYLIKAGAVDGARSVTQKILTDLEDQGAEVVVLACTELSLLGMYSERLELVDPLELLAKHLIEISLGKQVVDIGVVGIKLGSA